MNKIIVLSALWCPSCLIYKKYINRIRKEYNIEIDTLDYDFDEDKVKELNVGDKLPVIIYGDNRLIGEKTYDEIIEFLEGVKAIWEKKY